MSMKRRLLLKLLGGAGIGALATSFAGAAKANVAASESNNYGENDRAY